MITSIHNPKIQRIRDLLSHSSSRAEQKAFVVEGIRLVEEVIQAGVKPECVYISSQLNQRGMALIEKLRTSSTPVEEVEDNLLNRLSDTETSQGILAVLPEMQPSLPKTIDFVLILDSIRDPGNLGAILRTACAAGAQAILLSPECVDQYSPKVLRSAMGAHFHIPILKSSWEEIKKILTQEEAPFRIYLSDVREGDPLWRCDLSRPTAIIISNEATGATPAAQTLATDRIHIPMPGGFESLNASIAASILLFEVVRQRSKQ
jgi:RNA methyltransferase, TrmH family